MASEGQRSTARVDGQALEEHMRVSRGCEGVDMEPGSGCPELQS